MRKKHIALVAGLYLYKEDGTSKDTCPSGFGY
jgi:hypothetical protein